MSFSKSRLHITVALPCEARAFIDFYRLKQCSQVQTFPIYTNQNNTIYLIVSGIGKIRSAVATGFISAFTEYNRHACFLNLGIAGHANYAIGEIIQVHKVIDAATKQAWYLTGLNRLKILEAPIVTYDKPNTDYQDNALADMEAAGFFIGASQCVAQEQIQILKIISDNSLADIKNIKSAMVTQLIENKFAIINEAVQHLLQLSEDEYRNYQQSPCFLQFLQQWHFTDYQQHQLKELLRRWQVICPEKDPLMSAKILKTSSEVVFFLKGNLEKELLIK